MEKAVEPGVMVVERPGTITTTLYDLIEATASVVPDALVVATVVHFLRSRQIRFLGREDCRLRVVEDRQTASARVTAAETWQGGGWQHEGATD
jgi:hypothetical protein